MDSGQGYEKMKARDLTREIDRATDGMVETPVEPEGRSFVEFRGSERPELSDMRAQALGQQAISGRAERAETAAEVEVSEDENKLENPEVFVGEDTVEQRLEYSHEDHQDSLSERVGSKNRTVITRRVKDEVSAMMRQPRYELRNLTDLYREGNRLVVSATEEGREIGDRN